MAGRWVPLEEAREVVLAGRLHNPDRRRRHPRRAAPRARRAGERCGPADAPWPEHPAFRDR